MTAVPRRVRLAMLLRSFAVQGSWNYETLIGTGFAFTLLPALRWIYADRPHEMRSVLARHTELFNSHPYLSTVAAGAVSRLERDGIDPPVIDRLKLALRGSLGSLGDQLVWGTWRPLSVLMALVLMLAGAPWWIAVLVFLTVYNALHLALRVLGLRIGLEAGLEVGRVLRDAPIRALIHRGSQAAAFFVGIAVTLQAAPAFSGATALLPTVLAVALGLWLGTRTRRVMAFGLGAVAALAILSGLVGYGA